MTTTAGTKADTAASMRSEFIEMREAGATFGQIGDAYGYSAEMVRRVLGPDYAGHLDRRESPERAQLALDIAAYLEDNGPVPRDEVLAEFGLSDTQLAALIGEYELPVWLILTAPRGTKTVPQYTKADIKAALVRTWATFQNENPSAVGLPHVVYERLRGRDEPSAALLISRYGWQTICDEAGVPAGASYRPKDSYGSTWTDEDILRAVRAYVTECRVERQRPSYLGYDRWQRRSDDLPSGSLVRNRMRQIGLGTWNDIVLASLRD